MPHYIDIHSHVNFNAFDADRDDVIKRALENDTWVINVGTQKSTSKKAIEIAEMYEKGVYAVIGLHPVHTDASFHDVKELGEGGKEFTSHGEVFNSEEYRVLARHPKVVALGECGLDYYRMDTGSVQKQKAAFEEQISLANEINKPLMLHIRKAYKDALEILSTQSKVRGNVHFFAGTWEEAKAFLNLGYTLSFTGVVTFAREYDEVIRNVPLDMIMAETDSPYVTPTPYRGTRNEPVYVRETVKKIAEIRGEEVDKVAAQMVLTASRLFGI